MMKTPNPLTFRRLGGAFFVLSLCTVACDDDAKVEQPMRSMQQVPLPDVVPQALSNPTSKPAPAGADAPAQPAAARAPLMQATAPTDEPAHQHEPNAAPADKASEQFSVKRLVLTHGIRNKEPLPAESFVPDGTPVFAFVELSNPAAADGSIEIVFEHESGRRVGFVKLDVPAQSQRWRTWGQTRQIRESGQWVAVVRNGDGDELMRKSFAVGAS